jgi:hypothetical protein
MFQQTPAELRRLLEQIMATGTYIITSYITTKRHRKTLIWDIFSIGHNPLPHNNPLPHSNPLPHNNPLLLTKPLPSVFLIAMVLSETETILQEIDHIKVGKKVLMGFDIF